MGNSSSKEDEIRNLMHVVIVKDADLPVETIEHNNAIGIVVPTQVDKNAR